MDDTISRKMAIDALHKTMIKFFQTNDDDEPEFITASERMLLSVNKAISNALKTLPSAQPTLYGYNIEHLELIARVLQKEDLPPERVVEALTDIGRIVAIVRDEFEETLRRTVRNIERRTDG